MLFIHKNRPPLGNLEPHFTHWSTDFSNVYTACWRLIHKSGPNSPPTHTLKHSPTLVYDSFSYTGLRNHGNLDHTVIAQRTTVRCLCYPSVRLIHFTTVFFCECFFVHYFWVHPQKSTKERERTGQDVDSFFTLLLFTFSLPPRTNFGSLNLFVLIVCRRCYYCCCFSTLFIQLFFAFSLSLALPFQSRAL